MANEGIPDASSSFAADDVKMHPLTDALNAPAAREKLDKGVKLFFGSQAYPKAQKDLGEWKPNKKTNGFNKSAKEACEWTFLSAILELQERAVKEGGERLIPVSQVSLDSEPPTGHDRGRWPFLTRSSHFSNGFRTKRTAPGSCLSAAGRMASFVLGAVGSGVTC